MYRTEYPPEHTEVVSSHGTLIHDVYGICRGRVHRWRVGAVFVMRCRASAWDTKHGHTVASRSIDTVISVDHWNPVANSSDKFDTTARSTCLIEQGNRLTRPMGMAAPFGFSDTLNRLSSSDDKGFPAVRRPFPVPSPNPLRPFQRHTFVRRDWAVIKVTRWRLSATSSSPNFDYSLLLLSLNSCYLWSLLILQNYFADGSDDDFFYPNGTVLLLLSTRILVQLNRRNYSTNAIWSTRLL